MILKLTPSRLSGEVDAIDSKSELHRILICAALSDATTVIETSINPINLSNDVKATIDCLIALGADIVFGDNSITVSPITAVLEHPVLDCKESGSTLRFLMPVATALADCVTFDGNERLAERPIGSLKTAMEANGVTFSSDTLPFTTSGKLRSGIYEVTGDLSSQYVSGLLLTLPLLDADSEIRLTTPLLSRGYVELTIEALADYGITVVEPEIDAFKISPFARYKSPRSIRAEGDWSGAAFFHVANLLGNDITIGNLNMNSLQRDRHILSILGKYGYRNVDAEDKEKLLGAKTYEIDLGNTPDLLPALSIAAAFADGTTVFTGAARLRLKESDRLMSVCALINSLGGKAEDTDDGLIVYPQPLTGGTVETYGDHRIAMAATIASTRCEEPVIINEARAVEKSYPTFYQDIESLGGVIDVL